MAHITTSAPVAAGFGTKLSNVFSGLAAWFTREYEIRQTCNALSALSDRELADIGLHRVGLHSVVRARYDSV